MNPEDVLAMLEGRTIARVEGRNGSIVVTMGNPDDGEVTASFRAVLYSGRPFLEMQVQ